MTREAKLTVFLDFSKAFDTVPHEKLPSKLASYGIDGPLHTWLQDFLTNLHVTCKLY
ncbi:hypothetical protein DPMN_067439 [Dreissena polymorpha]|uniref:Reverse transcriptase domain-containing protein n=1 Tax=Dreissena polymorpha TaxID=45954 RepID=A0A9D3YV97_DREPO|nr:hypothetical protein DPMN_067439 [Dreissena polymorpha]